MTVGTSRSGHGRPGAQGFRILPTQPPGHGRSVPLYGVAGGTPLPEEDAEQPLGRRRLRDPAGLPPLGGGVFRGEAWRDRGRSLALDSLAPGRGCPRERGVPAIPRGLVKGRAATRVAASGGPMRCPGPANGFSLARSG